MKRLLYLLAAVMSGGGTLCAQSEQQIESVQYWIDDNQAAAQVSQAMEFDIDCSALSAGMHLLHFRLKDNAGAFSQLHEHVFFKVPAAVSGATITSLQYWWDDMRQNAVTAPYSAEQFALSTMALPYGLHRLNYRVKDSAGRWSECHSHYFYKGRYSEPSYIVSYSYWWNDLTDRTTTVPLAEPSTTFMLDVDFKVPEEARTDYAGHYTATLNIVVSDSNGRTAFVSQDVVYPDNDAPITDIDADKYVTASTVKLTWTESSNDVMGDYNVYVSKDDGPFVLWLADTKQTSATFKGEAGRVYVFTVTGRDALGNREKYDESKNVSVTFE